MSQTFVQVLPHNLEAERAVLGAVLIDQELWPTAATAITTREFYRDAHRRIFTAMQRLAERHQPIELVTLKDELERSGDLEEVGGPVYIAALVDGVPRATNVEYYAQVVREKAKFRALIFAANQILASAYEGEHEAEVLIDEAERSIMAVGSTHARGDFILADDWMVEVAAAVEHAYNTKRVVTGVPTGISKLDEMTRGFQAADLIYIGARPSAGKTSLALQMALHAARVSPDRMDGRMAGFVSIEMSRRVVGQRALAMETQITAFRLMTGFIQEHEMRRVATAIQTLSEMRLAIDDSAGQTAASLRAKVRRLASRHELGILFIDYMQLLRYSDGRDYENRNLELAAISSSLKALAKDLDIPIVVLSQLSRDSAKSGNRRPQVHDLRDSGALEQDADVVLLLHRPGQHDEGQRYGDGEPAELVIGKQRNGPTGIVRMQWLGSQMRFNEAAPEQEPQGALPV